MDDSLGQKGSLLTCAWRVSILGSAPPPDALFFSVTNPGSAFINWYTNVWNESYFDYFHL